MSARLVVLSTLAALLLPGVSGAKGPAAASLSGPGLDRVVPVDGNGEDGGTSALGRLVNAAGFFPAVFGQSPDPLLAGRPAGELGPRLTVTYRVPGPAGEDDRIVQELYLWAKGGPVVYTRPGQRFWTTERTRGGWFAGTSDLAPLLADLGVPAEAPGASGEGVVAGVPQPLVVALGGALLAAAGAIALVAVRRRRPHAAPA